MTNTATGVCYNWQEGYLSHINIGSCFTNTLQTENDKKCVK